MDAGFNLLGQFDEDLSLGGAPSEQLTQPSFDLNDFQNQHGGFQGGNSELVNTNTKNTG